MDRTVVTWVDGSAISTTSMRSATVSMKRFVKRSTSSPPVNCATSALQLTSHFSPATSDLTSIPTRYDVFCLPLAKRNKNVINIKLNNSKKSTEIYNCRCTKSNNCPSALSVEISYYMLYGINSLQSS